MRYLSRFFLCENLYSEDDERCQPGSSFTYALALIQSAVLPLLMSIYVPLLTTISSRFILQSMVQDKQNKMRETLRLMSLSQVSYALSYFLF